ncbi:MAG: LytTR family DNA-binding domain-containing protein, partial [Saprospiraceae bacterium]
FLKAMHRVGSGSLSNSLQASAQDTFYARDGNKNVRIKLSEVLYIKSEDNYVAFILPDTQTMALYSLKDLESKLPNNFKRVHRSFIVNLDKIDYIILDEISIRNKKIPIGQKYRDDLESTINTL